MQCPQGTCIQSQSNNRCVCNTVTNFPPQWYLHTLQTGDTMEYKPPSLLLLSAQQPPTALQCAAMNAVQVVAVAAQDNKNARQSLTHNGNKGDVGVRSAPPTHDITPTSTESVGINVMHTSKPLGTPLSDNSALRRKDITPISQGLYQSDAHLKTPLAYPSLAKACHPHQTAPRQA